MTLKTKLQKLSLNAKLWVLAGISVVSLAVVGSAGIFGTASLNDIFTEYRSTARLQKGVTRLSEMFLLARIDAFKFRLSGDQAFLQSASDQFASLNSSIDDLKAVSSDVETDRRLEAIRAPALRYAESLEIARLSDDQATQQRIFTQDLDVIGPELAGELVNFGSLLEQRQDTLGPEGAQQAQSLTQLMLGFFGVSIILAGVATWRVRASTLQQIGELRLSMKAVAASTTYDHDIPHQEVDGIIGSMGRALSDLQGDLKSKKESAEAAYEREKQAEKERTEFEARRKEETDRMERQNREKQREEQIALRRELAAEFEATIQSSIQSVASAGTQLMSVADDLTSIANETETGSETASHETRNTSSNVTDVSSSTEEMSASIAEISKQVQLASEVAQSAVHQSKGAAETVAVLETAGGRIGDVLALISDIAEQTNLLALNATIEAARAGDAGRGFAVVASEVKSLAGQSAKAADEIASEIENMQQATRNAVEALSQITETITSIDEVTITVSSAVEQQSAATTEISHAAQSAAASTGGIAAIVDQVAANASRTQSMSSEVKRASSAVHLETERMKREAMEFIDRMKD